MTSRFEATVRMHGAAAVIDLRGDIDRGAEAALQQAYAEATATAAPATVLLNFTDVEYINSTGIALIVGVLAKARAARLPIAACGLSEHYREIFEITRLSSFMTVFPDEASAVDGVTAPA